MEAVWEGEMLFWIFTSIDEQSQGCQFTVKSAEGFSLPPKLENQPLACWRNMHKLGSVGRTAVFSSLGIYLQLPGEGLSALMSKRKTWSGFKLGMFNWQPVGCTWPSSVCTMAHVTCSTSSWCQLCPPGTWGRHSAFLPNNISVCLICKEIVPVFKDYNLKKPYMQKHAAK